MSNHNPLAVNVSVLSQLTALEQEELFFLQECFMPLQGSVTKAIEDKLNGANPKGGVKCKANQIEIPI